MKEIVQLCLFENEYLLGKSPGINDDGLQRVFKRVEQISVGNAKMINLRVACNVAHYLRNSGNKANIYISALEHQESVSWKSQYWTEFSH